MRRNARRQPPVGGNQRHRPARRIEAFAHRQRDRLRLVRRIGEIKRRHPSERAFVRLQLAPLAGEGGGGEGVRRHYRAARRCVRFARRLPAPYFVARNAHPVEQQLEVILRMGFQSRRCGAIVGGIMRSERIPFGLRHSAIEIGENDHALRHEGERSQQPAYRWRGVGYARCDDERRIAALRPARADAVEQPVAMVGEVERAARGKFARPLFGKDAEQVERLAPVTRQFVAHFIGQRGQSRRFDALELHLVERPGERLSQCQGLGSVEWGRLLFVQSRDHPGEDEGPPQRIDHRGQRVAGVDRIEADAGCFGQIAIADRDDAREQQAAA